MSPIPSNRGGSVGRGRLSRAALAGTLSVLFVGQAAVAGVEASSWHPAERLSVALAAGRLRVDDMRGRKVYAFDETRIGTLFDAAEFASVTLDGCLGLGNGCITAPLARLLVAVERRLLFDMTPQEFRASVAAAGTCED
jgi:hypothetical protein